MNLSMSCGRCGDPLTLLTIEMARLDLNAVGIRLNHCGTCTQTDYRSGYNAWLVGEEARESLAPDDTTALLTRCANVVIGLIDWNQYVGQFEAPIWNQLYHLRRSLEQNRLDPRALCGHPFQSTDTICNVCEECPSCCVHLTDEEEEASE